MPEGAPMGVGDMGLSGTSVGGTEQDTEIKTAVVHEPEDIPVEMQMIGRDRGMFGLRRFGVDKVACSPEPYDEQMMPHHQRKDKSAQKDCKN